MREFFEAGEPVEADPQSAISKGTGCDRKAGVQIYTGPPGGCLGRYSRVNAGAGGTESCDWASILLRMYVMWAESHGFKLTEVERTDDDVAGIRSVSLEIEGEFAYGFLKGENGVHRLVRISPYNAQGKRQTSFASVFVSPIVDDSIEIVVPASECEWDTFRASGAGGQNVNKVETAGASQAHPIRYCCDMSGHPILSMTTVTVLCRCSNPNSMKENWRRETRNAIR
jgi:peptide chain release factor 2